MLWRFLLRESGVGANAAASTVQGRNRYVECVQAERNNWLSRSVGGLNPSESRIDRLLVIVGVKVVNLKWYVTATHLDCGEESRV